MTTATIFFGLFQGEYDTEEDATLVAVFSSESKASKFGTILSSQHIELKRKSYAALLLGGADSVPNLYWDTRPVVFDPRVLEELL